MTKPRWYGASLSNAHSCVDPAVAHDTGGSSHAARERGSFGLGTILMTGGPTMRWQRVSLAALHGRSHTRNSAHNQLRVVIDRWFPDTLVHVEGRCMSSYSPVGAHDFFKRFSKTRKFQVVEDERGLWPKSYLKIRGITRLQGGSHQHCHPRKCGSRENNVLCVHHQCKVLGGAALVQQACLRVLVENGLYAHVF